MGSHHFHGLTLLLCPGSSPGSSANVCRVLASLVRSHGGTAVVSSEQPPAAGFTRVDVVLSGDCLERTKRNLLRNLGGHWQKLLPPPEEYLRMEWLVRCNERQQLVPREVRTFLFSHILNYGRNGVCLTRAGLHAHRAGPSAEHVRTVCCARARGPATRCADKTHTPCLLCV